MMAADAKNGHFEAFVMDNVFMIGDEPIPGYRLREKLAGTAFYRQWKVQGPDGSFRHWKEIDLGFGNAAIETRTISLLVNIRHQNLSTFTNFWQLNDGRTLVVETDIPVMTLRVRLDKHREARTSMPREEALRYIEQAAAGLDFLNAPQHEHEGSKAAIYHRALALDTLLLFQDGRGLVCKVSDFGLAKPVIDSDDKNSQPLQRFDYDPPEFFESKVAPTSDQYALAVCYVELRTGRLPFEGSVLDQLYAKSSNQANLGSIPEPERSAIRRALDSDPASRYGSCLEFVAALKQAAASEATSSRVIGAAVLASHAVPNLLGEAAASRAQLSATAPVVSGNRLIPAQPVYEGAHSASNRPDRTMTPLAAETVIDRSILSMPKRETTPADVVERLRRQAALANEAARSETNSIRRQQMILPRENRVSLAVVAPVCLSIVAAAVYILLFL